MEIDRKTFIESLGGEDAVGKMDHESRADAIEHQMLHDLNAAIGSTKSGEKPAPEEPKKYPTAAEVVAQIETRPYRAGAGFMMVTRTGENMKRLPPMPANPTLVDFFNLRFMSTANHVLQSANLAMKNGMSEEIILACLLHDVVQELIRTDHGWWGAQLFEPYVPEKVAFAIRYHQALRYYADPSVGYEYPELYKELFGVDYVPPDYIEETYKMVRKHPWYMEPRLVALNDLYSFDPNVVVTIEPFLDIIGRHFRQPKEGLGNDGSPVAHMWRTIIRPDQPL
ncbi:MAG TPA: HD domain-containing protein [Candidatus Acidoferrales bacterium]|nr:HD domain-containing protein [Candidatus Acidoferrales bacterium]